MNINCITKDEFELFLCKIENKILKQAFIEEAKKCDRTSKYYIGKSGNGKFWNGFRITSILPDKIIKALVNIAYEDMKSFDLHNFSENILKIQYNIDIKNIEDKEIANIDDRKNVEIICRILEHEIPNEMDFIKNEKKKLESDYKKYKNNVENEYREFNKKIQELENLNLEYKQKLISKENECNLKIKNLTQDINNLKNKNNEIALQLESNTKELIKEKKYRIKKEDEIKELKKKCEKKEERLSDWKSGIESIISNINISDEEYNAIIDNKKDINKKNLNNVIEALLVKNIEKYDNKEDITKMLVVEYALIKIKEISK